MRINGVSAPPRVITVNVWHEYTWFTSLCNRNSVPLLRLRWHGRWLSRPHHSDCRSWFIAHIVLLREQSTHPLHHNNICGSQVGYMALLPLSKRPIPFLAPIIVDPRWAAIYALYRWFNLANVTRSAVFENQNTQRSWIPCITCCFLFLTSGLSLSFSLNYVSVTWWQINVHNMLHVCLKVHLHCVDKLKN